MAKVYRLTVPESDKDVIQWLSEQEKYSISLRLLIKQYIATHGMGDMISSFGSVPEPKRRQAQVRDVNEKVEETPTEQPASVEIKSEKIAEPAKAEPVRQVKEDSGSNDDIATRFGLNM